MKFMPYSEAKKKYCREWYHKNKKRLLADPKRKEAKKLSDKRDYQKHREKRIAAQKRYVSENRQKIKERRQQYWKRTRHIHLEKKKLQRQTEEYKAYMRAYREKNRDKINRQERISGARYIRRAVENLTDYYVISQILMSPLNKLTAAEIRLQPELIESKRDQIMSYRQKYGTAKMESDIFEQIGKAQKEREQKPYEFIKEWRD